MKQNEQKEEEKEDKEDKEQKQVRGGNAFFDPRVGRGLAVLCTHFFRRMAFSFLSVTNSSASFLAR